MRRAPLLVGPGLAAVVAVGVIASCGARTGLDIPFKEDAPFDASTHRDVTTHDAKRGHDATKDVPTDQGIDVPEIPPDGRVLDVVTECAAPPYCKPGDPGYVYKCGKRIVQCDLLSQCEVQCSTDGGGAQADAGACGARCIDPCKNSLGQNTSNGCEFYAAEMDTTPEADGVCYAVFVVNQWKTGQAAKLTVQLGDVTYMPAEMAQFARIPSGTGRNIAYAPYDPAVGIPKDEVAILFLSRDPAGLDDPTENDPRRLASCPPGVIPAVVGDAALHGTGVGTAFHIRSNVPVVAYQMLPYGGGSARITGATLLLPTNVWGTNYVAANAYAWPSVLASQQTIEDRAGPSMLVIAQANDTHVTLNPVAAILPGPGVPPTFAGHPITYTIDEGQYVQFTQQTELSGSAIQSDKPVAVIGGSTIMDVPVTTTQRADHGEQMLPPVQALGSQYVGVRYRSRIPGTDESIPWRILGVVDGTVLTFDPPQAGAPTQVNAHEVTEFDAPGPFVVTSQDDKHPFYVAQYMTGGARNVDAGPYLGTGDPEYVNVISPKQYLPRYTFFTDPTYPETNLVIVRVLDAATHQFPDVSLDCAGTLDGWKPVGASGDFEFTRIDLSHGDFRGQNGCNNGVHTITGSFSTDAGNASPFFGVTIWGWGNSVTDPAPDIPSTENDPNFTRWVSYAYPAGANILKLNDVVFPAQ